MAYFLYLPEYPHLTTKRQTGSLRHLLVIQVISVYANAYSAPSIHEIYILSFNGFGLLLIILMPFLGGKMLYFALHINLSEDQERQVGLAK